MSKTSVFVVLDDGETYSAAEGCLLVEVDDTIEGDDIEIALETLRDDGVALGVRVLARFT